MYGPTAVEHLQVIQRMMRHEDIRTSLNLYGHMAAGISDQAANAVDKAVPLARVPILRPQDQNRVAQLRPKCKKTPAEQGFYLVEVRGFEPLASSVRGKRSAGLSYTPNWATHVTPPGSAAKPVRNRCAAAGQPEGVPAQRWS